MGGKILSKNRFFYQVFNPLYGTFADPINNDFKPGNLSYG